MALSRIAIALKSVASVAFIAAGGHRLLPRAARHTSWSRVRVRPGPTAERMAGYPMTGAWTGACDGVATARLAAWGWLYSLNELELGSESAQKDHFVLP